MRFGAAETEIIEPEYKKGLTSGKLSMHHVGYVVADITQAMTDMIAKGFKFAVDKPISRERGVYLVVRLDGPGASIVHRMIDDARFADICALAILGRGADLGQPRQSTPRDVRQ